MDKLVLVSEIYKKKVLKVNWIKAENMDEESVNKNSIPHAILDERQAKKKISIPLMRTQQNIIQ